MDESSRELSLSDSDLVYELVESSGSATESEEGRIPPKSIRCSETRQPPVVPYTPMVNQETPTVLDHRIEGPVPAQQTPRIRAQTYLPDTLANPLWLPSNLGSATKSPFAQPGVQVNTYNFPGNFFYLFLPDTSVYREPVQTFCPTIYC